MMQVDLTTETKLGGIYTLPGEGFVVELKQGDTTHLFDKQGLQFRIVTKKQLGLDASIEEKALARINNVSARM